MTKKKALSIFGIGAISVLMLIALLKVSKSVISAIDKDYFFSEDCNLTNSVDANLKHKPINSFLDFSDTTLDCNEYLSGNILCFPNRLKEDFDSLSIIFKDEMRAEDFLFSILTDTILIRDQKYFNGFNPQKLMSYIVFSEKMKVLNTEKKYKYFYLGVSRFWLNKISNHLIELMSKEPDLRFDTKFRLLSSRCAQNGFQIPITNSSIEKVTEYLIKSRYSYVIERIWLRTSIPQKLVIAFILSLTIFSYFLLFQLFYKFINSKILKK
jgi:hypothetical protein